MTHAAGAGRGIGTMPLLRLAKRARRPGQQPKGGYSSGQRGQTVNLLAYAYGGSNPSPPTHPQRAVAFGERALSLSGRSASRLRRSARGCAVQGLRRRGAGVEPSPPTVKNRTWLCLLATSGTTTLRLGGYERVERSVANLRGRVL